jgi:uncharacterized cupredoxin-like copper-binding protein
MQLDTRPAPPPTQPLGAGLATALAAWAGATGMIAAASVSGGFEAGDLVGGLVLAGIALGVTAAVFGLAVRRALRPGGRPSTSGALLGALGVVTIVAFWSGLPVVLGAAAILLGLHARSGSGADTGLRARAAIGLGAIAIAGGVTAVASDSLGSSPAPAVVRVEAVEYGYVMPRQVTGGAVSLELANTGKQLHQLALVRLAGDRTADDLLVALDGAEDSEEADWIVDVAGVPALSPGASVTLTRTLDQPGTYVFFCLLPSPDFTPHASLGMIQQFEVAGDSGATLPQADVAITATESGFDVPAVAAGTVTLELRNAGQKPHELWLVAYDDGATDADVDAWFESGQQGPAPATFLGGIQSIPGGTSVFQRLELHAGTTYTLSDYSTGFESTFVPR